MSSLSPASVLFSSDGYELSAINGNVIPSNTRGLIIEGSDGSASRFVLVDTSGRLVINGAGTAGTNVGGVLTIQGNSAGVPVPVSADGYVTATAPTYAANALNFLSLTTAGSLRVDGYGGTFPASQLGTWTVQPGNTANTTPWLTTINQGGNSAAVKPASTPAVASDPALVVTISPNNPIAVSTDGYATTTAPSYSNNTSQPLSLTTIGALRVDGSAVTQPVAGTGADNTTNSTLKLPVLAARANTSAPSWTDGYMVPLSTDTSGNLRVTGFVLEDKSANSAITSVAASTSSVTLLASNTSRVLALFFNDTSNATLYLAFAATATTSAYTIKILPGSYWELPLTYTGVISGIWNNSSGSVRITEITP